MQIYIPLPRDTETALQSIKILRAASASPGEGDTITTLCVIPFLDDTGNFRTSWRDGALPLADVSEGGDPAALTGWWYQVQFLDSEDTVLWKGYLDPGYADTSGQRVDDAWTQGVAETMITPLDVRELILGLDSTLVTDWWMQKVIESQQGEIERDIRANMGSTLTTDEVHTGRDLNMLRLNHWPLLEIIELRIEFPLLLVHPRIMEPHWIKPVNMERGTIQIITDAAVNAYMVNRQGMLGQPGWNAFPSFPQSIFCTYRHGMSGLRVWQPLHKGAERRQETLTLPTDLKFAWAKKAAIEALQVWGDAKGTGISSESIDGVSRSYTASATTHIYSARIKSYTDDAERVIQKYRRTFMSFAA